jgi:hypothetical protein
MLNQILAAGGSGIFRGDLMSSRLITFSPIEAPNAGKGKQDMHKSNKVRRHMMNAPVEKFPSGIRGTIG